MHVFAFDLGETLIEYDVPMNWMANYHDGLVEVAKKYSRHLDKDLLNIGTDILEKYNTRLKPRITEVSSDTIFQDIFAAWGWNEDIRHAKSAFFAYFRHHTHAYDDALRVLPELRRQGARIGVLTDVPYGMDRDYVIEDCRPILGYVDVLLTSVEVGYRKPHDRGYLELASRLRSTPGDMVFVGNEEKDIIGAKRAGCFSVLIDRDATGLSFGEDRSIRTLMELV